MTNILESIQPINTKPLSVHVDALAERALRKGHPWVYAEALEKLSRRGDTGELAAVYNAKNKFMALGLFDASSEIRVRILQFKTPAQINALWFEEKLKSAQGIRKGLERQGTNGYRLIHGENDGMPGIVIDRYAATYVLKLYSAAWLPWLGQVISALQSQCAPKRVVLRLNRMLQKRTHNGVQDGMLLCGEAFTSPVVFQENGLNFEVDVQLGQKTGFFLDQRENRARLEALCKGHSVLNVFSYTGGFSLYAARGGAKQVVSVDSSHAALSAAVRNFEINQENTAIRKAEHTVECGDAFGVLANLAKERSQFGVVVIDPPAFAKSQSDKSSALQAYARLAQMGLKLLKREGHFVMASCSTQVSEAELRRAVLKTAQTEGRRLRIIEVTGHAVDHPITFPEGAYLKCLFCKSEN